MAGIIDRDELNKRTCVQFEMGGIQFRNNIVDADGCIPQHVHDYDHPYIVHGWFDVIITAPDGTIENYQVAGLEYKTDDPEFNPKGYLFCVPAGYQHTFIPRSENGNILCMWPG